MSKVTVVAWQIRSLKCLYKKPLLTQKHFSETAISSDSNPICIMNWFEFIWDSELGKSDRKVLWHVVLSAASHHSQRKRVGKAPSCGQMLQLENKRCFVWMKQRTESDNWKYWKKKLLPMTDTALKTLFVVDPSVHVMWCIFKMTHLRWCCVYSGKESSTYCKLRKQLHQFDDTCAAKSHNTTLQWWSVLCELHKTLNFSWVHHFFGNISVVFSICMCLKCVELSLPPHVWPTCADHTDTHHSLSNDRAKSHSATVWVCNTTESWDHRL